MSRRAPDKNRFWPICGPAELGRLSDDGGPARLIAGCGSNRWKIAGYCRSLSTRSWTRTTASEWAAFRSRSHRRGGTRRDDRLLRHRNDQSHGRHLKFGKALTINKSLTINGPGATANDQGL